MQIISRRRSEEHDANLLRFAGKPKWKCFVEFRKHFQGLPQKSDKITSEMEELFAETFPAFRKHFKLSKMSLKGDILVHTTYSIIISVYSRDRPENCTDHALAFFVAPFPDNLVESRERGSGDGGKRMGVGVRLFSISIWKMLSLCSHIEKPHALLT